MPNCTSAPNWQVEVTFDHVIMNRSPGLLFGEPMNLQAASVIEAAFLSRSVRTIP
jgi:hypothetical protein